MLLSTVLTLCATASAAISLPSVPEPIAPVSMSCPANGIDVNRATTAQLTSLPGISRPIADRIVANRPYLRTDPDLLRVEGIGAGKMAAIKADGRACATPPTLPPPVFDVCRSGEGEIDANRPQSLADLARLFGMPTADRIVAGIPYWSLNHVRSEGEAGAGAGKMSKHLDELCLTPPTIDFNGTRYGWIDSVRGGLVDLASGGGRPSYRLTVPGGLVSDDPGAWGSITPIDSAVVVPDAPAANFHIHGGHEGAVFVGLPPDSVGTEPTREWIDTVWHLPADDEWEIIWGDDVDRVDDRVTARTGSLSDFVGARQPARQFGAWVIDWVVKAATWAERTIRQIMGTGAAAPTCSPNTQEGEQYDGAILETDGFLLKPFSSFTPPIWHCIQRQDRRRAIWRYVLNRSVSLVVRDDGLPASRATDLALTGDLLVDATVIPYGALQMGTGRPFVLPGTARLDVVRESSREYGTLRVDGVGSTIAATVVVQALREAGFLMPPGTDALFAAVNDCLEPGAIHVLGYDSGGATYDAVLGVVSSVLRCVAANASTRGLEDLLRSKGLVDAGDIVRKLSRALLVVKALNYGVLAYDLIGIGVVGDEGNDIEMRFKAPPAPPPRPAGQPTSGDLPSGSDSLPPNVILKRAGSSAAYWLDSDRDAHRIPDGGTYICLAQAMPVWFGVDDAEWTVAVRGNASAADATCPPAPAAPRSLSPDNAHDVLMRDTSGGWYLIRDDGTRTYLLFEGSEPSCLFDNMLVWDHVTTIELARFDNRPADAGTVVCWGGGPIQGG